MGCENGVCDIPMPLACAEASCFYNTNGYCMVTGYNGPTMEGECKLYERD